jgi:hypothetical protein
MLKCATSIELQKLNKNVVALCFSRIIEILLKKTKNNNKINDECTIELYLKELKKGFNLCSHSVVIIDTMYRVLMQFNRQKKILYPYP